MNGPSNIVTWAWKLSRKLKAPARPTRHPRRCYPPPLRHRIVSEGSSGGRPIHHFSGRGQAECASANPSGTGEGVVATARNVLTSASTGASEGVIAVGWAASGAD